jgi:ankyrin repeat protein/outer membrane protein assembly factor BamD (BamD/ComL family)
MITLKTSSFKFMLTIVILIGLFGCATTKRDWQEANRQGTIEAFEKFLQKHPSTEQANDARRLLPEMRADEDWSQVKVTNTIDAYEEFISKYPRSKHIKQAGNAMESLRFEQAKASDSIDAYESYLKHHPDGFAAQDAQSRLRKARYAKAIKRMTVPDLESFLAQYHEGADVDMIKSKLSALQTLEKSFLLGKKIMKHAPKAYVNVTLNLGGGGGPPLPMSTSGWYIPCSSADQITTKRSDPTDEDLARLRAILSDGANPNVVRVSGFSPANVKKSDSGSLMCSTGDIGSIVQAEDGGITLFEYCQINDLKSIASLLVNAQGGSDIVLLDKLIRASKEGDISKVKSILALGVDINACDNLKNTPLHWAVLEGHSSLVDYFLQHGADVNAKDKAGTTPLHKAVAKGNVLLVRDLIFHSADVNAQNNEAATPLLVASLVNNVNIAKILLDSGASPNPVGFVRSPLIIATEKGNKDLTDLLIFHGAAIDYKDEHGFTPLHWAAYMNHSDLIKVLLAHGADLEEKENSGYTALEIARLKNNISASKILEGKLKN